MALDTGSTNTTRYHSVPDSADFTLPNADWCWLFPANVKAAGNNYFISTGTFAAVNSFNFLHLSDSTLGCQFNNTVLLSTGLTPPLDTEHLYFAQRVNNILEAGYVTLSGTLAKTTGANIASTTSNGTGLWLQSRSDLNVDRMQKGRINNVTLVSGKSVTDDDLKAIAQGASILSMGFAPNIKCLFDFHNADNATTTSLIGGHVATRVGTGWGSDEEDIITPYADDVIYIYSAVAGGAISINGTIAPLVLSGLSGQVDQGAGINAAVASLALSGTAGQVDLGHNINGTPAALNISGLAGQVDMGAGINGIAASLSIIGLTGAVTLGSDILINGTPASLSLSGQSGQVDLGVNINGSIASIILTGLAGGVSVGNDILINGTPASITLSGLNATVTQETSINGVPATITLTGMVGAVSQDITVNGSPASIALSPITGEVVQNTIISGTPATLTILGVTGAITSGAVVTILAAQGIEMKLFNTAIDMGLYNSSIEIKS